MSRTVAHPGQEIVKTGTESEWDVAYVKDGATGTIHLAFGGTSLTSGTFFFNHV